MRTSAVSLLLAAVPALAAEPFLNEADTGFQTYLTGTANWTEGSLPSLQDIRALPDFDYAARQGMADEDYAYYRLAAGQEWGYRHNLDVWSKVQFRPRFLRDVSSFSNETLGVEVLGHNFSLPFFIAPASQGGRANPERAELNYMEAAGAANMLYIPALYATKTIEELAAVRGEDQVIFQQIYSVLNMTVFWTDIDRAVTAGAKAIVLTADTPGSSVRIRFARYTAGEASAGATRPLNWEIVDEVKNRTSLPVILKGIQTVEDAVEAVRRGVDAIYISNHGGRQLEFSPAPVEVAYEIRKYAPEVFDQIPVLADSGVRSGTDVLKLLALGVRAVGLGRSFHFANVYGREGVDKAIRLLTNEIVQDGWNLGINSLDDLNPSLLNLRTLSHEARDLVKMQDGTFSESSL